MRKHDSCRAQLLSLRRWCTPHQLIQEGLRPLLGPYSAWCNLPPKSMWGARHVSGSEQHGLTSTPCSKHLLQQHDNALWQIMHVALACHSNTQSVYQYYGFLLALHECCWAKSCRSIYGLTAGFWGHATHRGDSWHVSWFGPSSPPMLHRQPHTTTTPPTLGCFSTQQPMRFDTTRLPTLHESTQACSHAQDYGTQSMGGHVLQGSSRRNR